jgi:hypothetical protein
MLRRSALKLVGATALFGSVGTASAGTGADESDDSNGSEGTDEPEGAGETGGGRIEKLGRSLLSDPDGEFAEEDVREDGRYGVVGSFFGEGGSFLVGLEDLEDPEEIHQLSSSPAVRNADVAFDPRDGLYYRSQEPNEEDAEIAGVEVIDYGYEEGTPEEPEIVAALDTGPTHNLSPHPEEPILYAVNEEPGGSGFDVWDVSKPSDPEQIGSAGITGAVHDIAIDTDRELLHTAYITDAPDEFDQEEDFAGYAIFDASDPEDPEEVGRFDYAGTLDYGEVPIGQEAFENCHYVEFDPDRELAYVGDEIGFGNPGGKHVFDLDWGEGSLEEPEPIGYTLSPNAQFMNADPDADGEREQTQAFDWTGHNFDVLTRGDRTLLVSGDYHEGVVLYDVTDPEEPTPIDRYATDDDAEDVSELLFPIGGSPMAWGANYNDEREFVFTSDMATGVYTFRIRADDGDGSEDGDEGDGEDEGNDDGDEKKNRDDEDDEDDGEGGKEDEDGDGKVDK